MIIPCLDSEVYFFYQYRVPAGATWVLTLDSFQLGSKIIVANYATSWGDSPGKEGEQMTYVYMTEPLTLS